jgi:hypothetical protein
VRYPLSRLDQLRSVLAGLFGSWLVVRVGIGPLRAAISRGHPQGWEYLGLPVGFMVWLTCLVVVVGAAPYVLWRRPRIDITPTRFINSSWAPLTLRWDGIERIKLDKFEHNVLFEPSIVVVGKWSEPQSGNRVRRGSPLHRVGGRE